MSIAIVDAEPEAVSIDPARTALIIIDMQRDFLEPGGFGETLGNDVSLLQRAQSSRARRCSRQRARRACSSSTPARATAPTLSDAPPAKIERGRAQHAHRRRRARWAASSSAAKPGTTSSPSSIPQRGEPVIDKPGKGAFYATDLHAILQNRGIETLIVCGVTTEVCVHTTVREANDRGYRCIVLARLLRLVLPRVPRGGPAHDQGAGRDLRLGLELRRAFSRLWRPARPSSASAATA